MKLHIVGDKYKIEMSDSYIPEYDVIKEYFAILRNIENGEQASVVLEIGELRKWPSFSF